MATQRRINVSSGRALEATAHYSRALRVGDTVLQAGTTATGRIEGVWGSSSRVAPTVKGDVRGVGDVAKQVEAIMALAEWSMGKAGGRLDDVVRSRIYVTDIALADQAARAIATRFRDARPASTLVEVIGLARPEQLIEIELEAVDGAGAQARRIGSGRSIEDEYAYSRAVRVGDRVYISGTTALTPRGVVESAGDMYRQTRAVMDTIFAALAEAGGTPADLVYTKSFFSDLTQMAGYTRAWLEALGDLRPTSTTLGIPALLHPDMLIEIEAEAVIGASRTRRDGYTQQQREKPRGYARTVEVGDRIYMSGCTDLDAAGELQAPNDWAAQYDHALETVRWSLEQAGASLDDVVRRQTFTVTSAQVNRAFGQGPAYFAGSRPASMGCRIAGLARPELLVEVEVMAVKGAGTGIESIGPDPIDPL
jgi:enamine deaminase RidA (YjgF/YER057c/UK114 family)